jgi:glycosyltransferase involved in cell wall biosynthesis
LIGVINLEEVRLTQLNSISKAHVIIPTHSAHDTLALTALSAVNQTLAPHRITIIGDGATPEVRKVAEKLSREHAVIEFLDKPKLKNRGEKYRDEVIKSSDADFVTYLCDDDLYMPNHLEVMAKHLEEFDFVHPRPTFVNPDGTFFFLPSGIESQRIRDWHTLEPPRNTISLTGASHTIASYLSLDVGWDAGPPEIWTDLFMWAKFFAKPDVTTYTSPFTTTIKLMHTKEQRTLLSRSELVQHWYNLTRQPDQLAMFLSQVETQFKEFAFNNYLESNRLKAVTVRLEEQIAERDALLAEK